MKHKETLHIIIPVRIDSTERFRNLKLVLQSLFSMGISVTVLEADKQSHCAALLSSFNYHYKFVEDADSVFHRTRYLNQLLRACPTTVVGVWDTDIMLSESQIEQSLNAILSEGYIMSSPYNGDFRFLTAQQSELYAANPDYSFLSTCFPTTTSFRKRASWGGAFFVDKKAYIQCGGENENFYGWGPEDVERVHRLEILGHPVHRVNDKPLYHLWHPRGMNSSLIDDNRAFINRLELIKVCSMTRNELKQTVTTQK